jgi:hypothetical protein
MKTVFLAFGLIMNVTSNFIDGIVCYTSVGIVEFPWLQKWRHNQTLGIS